jgi:hypothetical protein
MGMVTVMPQNKNDVEGFVTVYEGIELRGVGFGGTGGTGHYFLTKEDFNKCRNKLHGFQTITCVKIGENYYELKSTTPLTIQTDEHHKLDRFTELTNSMSSADLTFLKEYILEKETQHKE